MAWDDYHRRATEKLLRFDIETGRADLPYLKKIYQERVTKEDYEGAKSINKLIQELKTKKQKQL